MHWKEPEDCISNIDIYSMNNTEPLVYYVRKRQLGFLRHILCLPGKEPARNMLFMYHLMAKRSRIVQASLTSRTSNGCLGYHEVYISADEIATLAEDRCALRNLVIACSAAEG